MKYFFNVIARSKILSVIARSKATKQSRRDCFASLAMTTRKFVITISYILIFIFPLFFGNIFSIARAEDSCASLLNQSDCSSNNYTFCCWDGSVCKTGTRIPADPADQIGTCASSEEGVNTLRGDLINPFSGSTDVVTTTELVARVIKWIFAIVGALALLMFIIGGTYWLVSFGNETRITKGRQILIWASVGLLLIFSSYAIINYVLWSLVG